MIKFADRYYISYPKSQESYKDLGLNGISVFFGVESKYLLLSGLLHEYGANTSLLSRNGRRAGLVNDHAETRSYRNRGIVVGGERTCDHIYEIRRPVDYSILETKKCRSLYAEATGYLKAQERGLL
jgi:hypothetical protein